MLSSLDNLLVHKQLFVACFLKLSSSICLICTHSIIEINYMKIAQVNFQLCTLTKSDDIVVELYTHPTSNREKKYTYSIFPKRPPLKIKATEIYSEGYSKTRGCLCIFNQSSQPWTQRIIW